MADDLNDLDLVKIFRHQDVALSKNFQNSQLVQAFSALLSRLIFVNFAILRGVTFSPAKQTAIRLFATDSLSHIAIAARVGLWGALPESLSVLRSGVESAAQLAFVILNQRYEAAISEANSRKFAELEFTTVCRALGEQGKAFMRVHGEISNLASHSTSRRIRFAEYKIEGEAYDRLGVTLDAENAELAVGECLELGQSVASSLRAAYSHEAVPFGWIDDLQAIFETHEALKQRYKAECEVRRS